MTMLEQLRAGDVILIWKIRERTKAGLAAARARGRVGGRPKGLTRRAKRKAEAAAALYRERSHSIAQICETLQICKATFYRYLAYEGVEVGRAPVHSR